MRDGVDKYGAGKWRVIQKDLVFGAILSTRSNVDLKVRKEEREERERGRRKKKREKSLNKSFSTREREREN